MDSNRYCVIMAGGSGTRLWPRSRRQEPKQFLDPLGVGRSMLRLTYERCLRVVSPENIIVVTLRRWQDLVLEHLPELNPDQIILEPIGRDTAPAVCYAAHCIARKSPDAEMIVTPADHKIEDIEEFAREIDRGAEFVKGSGALLSIGIPPSRPETGYGYIQMGDRTESISPVKFFTEKPILEVAESFVQCGEFLWNSGIFIWRVRDIISTLEQHMGEQSHLFASIKDSYGTDGEGEAISRVYSECRPQSLDRVVMERADNLYVMRSSFDWSDIGTWNSLHEATPRDDMGNVSHGGETLFMNTRDSIISLPNGKMAVVSGLDGYIVSDSGDLLLISPRGEAGGIKELLDELKFRTEEKYL